MCKRSAYMKSNMANFFPMLSSSPPPIDDADSPENDDDDDFGIFASASNAFDCSFDNSVFKKSISSHDNSMQTKIIEKDFSKNFRATCNTCVNEVSVEIESQSQNLLHESETVHKESDSAERNVDYKKNIFVNSCDTGFHENSQRSFSSGHVKELLENGQEYSEKSQFSVSNSSHCTSSNSMSKKTHYVADDSTSTGDLNVVDHKLTIKSEQTVQKESEDSNVLSNSEVLSQEDNVTVFSEETNEFGVVEETNSDSIKDPSFIPNDILQHSPILKYSTCHVINTCENYNLESNTLGTDDMNHREFLGSGEVPDLTFIPFSAEERNESLDDFNEFLDSDFCTAITEQDVQCDTTIDNDHPSKSALNKSLGSEEEFGNFESGELVISKDLSNCDVVEESTDFADFKSNEFPSNKYCSAVSSIPDAELEDFADFETASLESQLKVPVSVPKESEKGLDKLSTVINAVFPVCEEVVEGTCENTCEVLEQSCKSRRLWERLHDTDETPGLPFQWSVSHSFQQLLHSVNVDYHSILRTSTVPFFASGLGLLEPTKGIATTVEIKTDNDFQNIKEPIPPVEFDWGSSGLVNPLDSGQSISILMDLSFLNSSATTSSEGSGGKDFCLENELATEPEPSTSDSSQKAPILEQLLSLGAKSSLAESYPSSRPPNLSQETVRVLDQLPDISFMRAQVLMFPVLNNT